MTRLTRSWKWSRDDHLVITPWLDDLNGTGRFFLFKDTSRGNPAETVTRCVLVPAACNTREKVEKYCIGRLGSLGWVVDSTGYWNGPMKYRAPFN